MSVHRKPWDEDDEDKTPYGVSGEPLPPRPDVANDVELGDEIVAKPRRKKAELADDDAPPPDDPPVRKKKRRKKDRTFILPDPDDERDKEKEKREWSIAGVLFGIGFALMIAGAVGVAGKKDFEEIRTGALVFASLVSIAISIPVTILALIVGGSVLGIEYGTPVSAIRNIASIFMFMDGLDWVFTWAGAPLAGRIATLLIGYGLLMNRFELDVWELWATVIAMKAVGFAVHVALAFALFAAVSKKDKERALVIDRPAAVAQVRIIGPSGT
jgi:hypothetical protein